MEYLLKSAIISAIVYLFYKIFLQKETFFQSMRIYFIVGIIVSILLPIVIIPIYIEVAEIIVPEAIINIPVVESLIKVEAIEIPIETKKTFNWLTLIGSIYLIGVVVLVIKFLIDLIALLSLLFYGIKTKTEKYIFVETEKELLPFSFFKFIVYNKEKFTKTELKDIIAHEKVHVRQKHSLDILLIQIVAIAQWYNPFIWLYKKDLQQNLEYIADKEAQEKAENHKKYQYLLLKTSIKNNPFALSNNFFNSHLKKRIMMLQKSQTKRLNQIKYLLLIPLLAIFLYAFNTKEIIQNNKKEDVSKKEGNSKNTGEEQTFINPIIKDNVIKISSYFGKRIDPLTKKNKFHNGIDIRAYKDMDVYATAEGRVIKAEYNELKGNYIQIQHANNYQTNYHHLGNIQVGEGDKVQIGEIIGVVGNTGRSTGIHLHYEIIKEGKNIDPKPYVNYSNNTKIKRNISLNAAALSKKQPTKKQMISWEEKREYGVWIDGKKIDNKALKNYSNSSFLNYHVSKLEKNATNYGKHYYQVNLMTKTYYIKYLKNRRAWEFSQYTTIITSKTTDKEFEKIKKQFKKKHNVKLKFYEIKRNKNKEIIAIKIDGKVKGTESSFSFRQDYPISKIIVAYDKDKNEIFIENKGLRKHPKKGTRTKSKTSTHHYHSNTAVGTKTKNIHQTQLKSEVEENEEAEEEEEIEAEEENTVTTYEVNGTKVSKEEYERIDKNKIKNLTINKVTKISSNITSGSVEYNGETYYYSKSKKKNIFCAGECEKEVISRLSGEDQKEAQKITKNGKTYTLYENVNEVTFYNRFGNNVEKKLTRQLMKNLEKK